MVLPLRVKETDGGFEIAGYEATSFPFQVHRNALFGYFACCTVQLYLALDSVTLAGEMKDVLFPSKYAKYVPLVEDVRVVSRLQTNEAPVDPE